MATNPVTLALEAAIYAVFEVSKVVKKSILTHTRAGLDGY